uniref:Uncharacterized protein LOC104228852 n=1 Tax=Nicotiana sylvestris TaxID=4096 RepID=A0A1U7WYF2_NICSY|nr:PREDICTED: uncharacterized protein LOC104228852 [Nicotiana sylvestris]
MEKDCSGSVRNCHQCQIHGDLIHALPSELHPMLAPWSFVAWGMNVIGQIEPKASNGQKFILVAFDYFTKWVEAVNFNAATKKTVVDSEVCEQFKIMHRNSTPYRPKVNGDVEATNKNIKKILKKMIQRYRTTVRTSVRATPYLLVYGIEAVISAEVEIPSLQIIVEDEIEDDEWVKTRLEQLTIIDEKWMATVCHGQLYQQRKAYAYNKKVQPRNFEMGKLVLRRILPYHEEAKGKFVPNCKGPYIVRRRLPKGELYLEDIEGNDPETTVNADVVTRYYV